jgi:hypothetical protein
MTTATEELRAYHGDQAVKDKLLGRIGAHEEADAIVSGTYGVKEGKIWKACAVGCSVNDLTQDNRLSRPHARYPEILGIPEWIAYLEDGIFEGMTEEKRAGFPRRFAEAIPVGADFEGLADRLAIRRLKEECLPLSGHWPESVKAKVVASIEQTIAALEGKADREEAWSAAESAAWSAELAARSAAWSARSAARSAELAAWSARSAWSAARSAELAARSAARSAELAAWSAWSARSAAFDREADRLIAELASLTCWEIEEVDVASH